MFFGLPAELTAGSVKTYVSSNSLEVVFFIVVVRSANQRTGRERSATMEGSRAGVFGLAYCQNPNSGLEILIVVVRSANERLIAERSATRVGGHLLIISCVLLGKSGFCMLPQPFQHFTLVAPSAGQIAGKTEILRVLLH